MAPKPFLLAPMQLELDAVVVRCGLDRAAPDRAVGVVAGVEVVAWRTDIGMAAAERAAHAAIAAGATHLAVVGIAGGLRREDPIGTVLRPATVLDRRDGTTVATGFERGAGILSCGDEFVDDTSRLAEWRAEGVVGVDMETAAVARVALAAGVAWSLHRAVSDHPGAGVVGDDVWALTRPDGSPDPDALHALLDSPEHRARLARLAADATTAAGAAAADVLEHVVALGRDHS